VVPFTLLNGFLDFLGGAFTSVKYVIFTLIGMIFIGMITLAIKGKTASRSSQWTCRASARSLESSIH